MNPIGVMETRGAARAVNHWAGVLVQLENVVLDDLDETVDVLVYVDEIGEALWDDLPKLVAIAAKCDELFVSVRDWFSPAGVRAEKSRLLQLISDTEPKGLALPGLVDPEMLRSFPSSINSLEITGELNADVVSAIVESMPHLQRLKLDALVDDDRPEDWSALDGLAVLDDLVDLEIDIQGRRRDKGPIIRSIATLTQLRHLTFECWSIDDYSILEPFVELAGLESLRLRPALNEERGGAAWISKLEGLTFLELDHRAQLPTLTLPPQMRTLHLPYTRVSMQDFSVIENPSVVETLIVSSPGIEPPELERLHVFDNLRTLLLGRCDYTNAELAALRKLRLSEFVAYIDEEADADALARSLRTEAGIGHVVLERYGR